MLTFNYFLNDIIGLKKRFQYFPGRKPVLNYLTRLSDEVKKFEKKLNYTQWETLVKFTEVSI